MRGGMVFSHPDINRQVALDHVEGLRRAAELFRFRRDASPRRTLPSLGSVQLRLTHCRDELERLAALSETRAHSGEWLVADVDGVPVAAVALDDGATLADPFRPTQQVVSLLELRKKQVLAAA